MGAREPLAELHGTASRRSLSLAKCFPSVGSASFVI